MASLSRDCKLPHFPKCTLFPKFCISIVFNFSWDAVIPRRNEKQRLCNFFFVWGGGGGGDKVHHGKCGSGVEVNMLATNLTIYLNRKILCSRDLVLMS